MPADGHGLLPGEADEAVGDIYALLAVAVGEGVVKGVRGDFGPLAGGVVLHVAEALFVAVDFAQVVAQGDNCDGLAAVVQAIQLLHPLPLKVVRQTVVDVQAVLAQSSLVSPVVPGGGGRGKEIASVFQEIQQLVGSLPGDMRFKNLNKLLFAGHKRSSF